MISIVVPIYNRPKLLKELCTSILLQSSSDWELIIVDDQSTDETFEVAKEISTTDNRIRCLQRYNDKIKGPSSCRNIGASFAQGEYIIFFDSDDLFFPWCIEELKIEMNKRPDVDCGIFQQISYHNGAENILWYRSIKENLEGYIKRFIKFQYSFSTHSVIWRKEKFIQSVGWDENLGVWEDPYLHIQCMKNSFNFEWISDTPMGIIRMGTAENQITSHTDLRDFVHITGHLKKILNKGEFDLWYKTIFSKLVDIMISIKDRGEFQRTWLVFKKELKLNKFQLYAVFLFLRINRFFIKTPLIKGILYRLSYTFRAKINTFVPSYPSVEEIKLLSEKINKLDDKSREEIMNISNLKL
tara:strand:+ start:417 stop:1484 length:1068 start_codon:yes stop_codon:yes gene_type:complete